MCHPTDDPPMQPDRISARDAASVLDLGYPGRFNRIRRRLQRVWNRDDGTHRPYPDDLSTDAERAFNRDHVLVVPEWGGVSYYGSDWSYSAQRCAEWASGAALG